uniref:ZP domain-containing protein n=1 Tax=Caenorhabditis tropicalis TaxID=1561998 RepID=A0A1I7U8Y6_9PELO
MPHSLSILLLLLSSSCHVASQAPPHDPLPVLNVPIGAGQTPDASTLKAFGMYGELLPSGEFNTCGKKTVTNLNSNFPTGGNLEMEVICEPSPDRIIIRADGNAFNYGQFQRDLKKECELLTCSSNDYSGKGTTLGTLDIKDTSDVSVVSGEPEKPEISVCDGKEPGFSNGATGSILFANEAQCFRTYNSLQATLQTADFIQIPRWLQPGEKVRNKRSAFYDGEHNHFFKRIPYGFKSENSKGSLNYKECNSACDSGKVVKMTMKKTQYKISITVDPKNCQFFRICLSADGHENDQQIPVCNNDRMIDVQIHNGIVIWPNQGRASLIELRSPHADLSRPVVIEFGYGIQISGQSRAEYYIGNDHREIVTSTSAGFLQADSRKIAFFFPNENCLVPTAGIFHEDVTVGQLFDDNLVPLIPLNASQNEIPKTTTVAPIEDIIATTTKSPPRAIPGIAVLPEAEKLFESQQKHSAVYLTGKWWTWGLYLGFVIGTLLTLAIGGGAFYALRRTIFGVWYRGMYKRYGCDVSGTTGGLTGVGFSNTVTGDVTVQGTAGGTTIGGTTGGTSTMGGTTGASTMGTTEKSTLLDKTGGETKSIAM